MSNKQLIGDADNCFDNLFEFNQSFQDNHLQKG